MSTVPLTQIESLFPKEFGRCAACGTTEPDAHVQGWIECDLPNDRPTDRVVCLCKRCGDKLIEPHPLLYVQLELHRPFPGAMTDCVGCAHAQGMTCTNPLRKSLGGPGVPVKFAKPAHALVKMTGGCRAMSIYFSPPVCEGRRDRIDTADTNTTTASPTQEP